MPSDSTSPASPESLISQMDDHNLPREPASPLPGALARANPPLSPTETHVYALLLQRLTEQQVAAQMGRSPNTIHVHVRNIYRKMSVRTRQMLYELAKIENLDEGDER